MSVAGASIHPGVAEVAMTLDAARVRWVLQRLPEGGLQAPTGDLDLLVASADIGVVTRALRPLGFVRVPRAGTDLHLLRYCEKTLRWLWLHIVTTLTFGAHPAVAVADAALVTRVRRVEGIARLPADLEFWALLWHCLADKRRVALHHRPALRAAAADADAHSETARRFEQAVHIPGLAARLRDRVIEDDWSSIEVEASAFARVRTAHKRSKRDRIRRAAVRRMDTLLNWRERRGLSVAVLGPDGAGKSTLVDAMAGAVPFPVRIFYMGLTGGALRHIRRLRVPGVVFAGSICVLWSRYLRAWTCMARGTLVLFDRYVYDGVAPPGYQPGAFERTGRLLSAHLCPDPDLVLLLDAPGHVMFARKGEYDGATLESWRQHFLTLRSRVRGLEVIDATRPAADVRADAVALIWRSYAERWESLSEPEAATP